MGEPFASFSLTTSEQRTQPGGKTWAEAMQGQGGLEKDAHGNIQLSGSGALGGVAERLGIDTGELAAMRGQLGDNSQARADAVGLECGDGVTA